MSLPQDTAIELAKMRALLPPEPTATTLPGARLTITGLDPPEYDWVQDADNELREGIGDPNGLLRAPISTLYLDETSGAPKLWQNQDGGTTWTDLTAGGGSFTLGTYSDTVGADTPTTVNLNGSNHTVTMAVASPPAWFSSGNIITAGLYAIGATFQHVTAATTPGKFFYVWGPGNGGALNTVDALDAFPGTGISIIQETLALTATDLPFAVSFIVHGQSDATAQVNVLPYVVPLLL